MAPNQWQPWSQYDIEFACKRTDLSIAERASILGRTVWGVKEVIRKTRVQN